MRAATLDQSILVSPTRPSEVTMQVMTGRRAALHDWAARGACRDSDPELFFPVTSAGPAARQVARAKAVCARCPVRDECLEFALASGQDFGVWGGASEEERRLLRRRRLRHRRVA